VETLTVATSMPAHIKPMLATLAKALPADEELWTFEFKWDGIRAIAFWDGSALRLETRNLRDVSVSWPELDAIGPALGKRTVILDGEIAALNESGVASFQRLQERMHIGSREVAARKAATVPASLLVFDVLHLDGRDLMPLSWIQRREILESLSLAGPSWATTPSLPGAGTELLETVRQRRMEGVICKRLDSIYAPGARSRSWLKVKIQQSDEFVVGGWQPGEGRRTNRIGSLLLGVPDGKGGLDYVGNVGTGFTEAELDRLATRLGPTVRETSPFTGGGMPKRRSVFVEPELVVEVEFTERTDEGILRHPSYKGVRIDKGVTDVETG
jgi:bifunctional non-homologous end joining protein LigD